MIPTIFGIVKGLITGKVKFTGSECTRLGYQYLFDPNQNDQTHLLTSFPSNSNVQAKLPIATERATILAQLAEINPKNTITTDLPNFPEIIASKPMDFGGKYVFASTKSLFQIFY